LVPSECLLFRTLILIRGVKVGAQEKYVNGRTIIREFFTVRELLKVGQYDRNGTRISKGMAVNLELVPIN